MYLHAIIQRSKGGVKSTMCTYSGRITHFVNFVERQPYLKKFSDLLDTFFRHFIRTLQTERKSNEQLNRVR